MNKIEKQDDIHIYEEFLTKEESEKTLNCLLEYAETIPDFWKAISFYESYSSGYPEDNHPLLEKHGLPSNWFSDIEQRFKEAAADVAKVPVEKISKISYHTQRWLPGAFANIHSDNTTNDGVYGAFTRSRYAGFLYLNDNFEGGMLHFQADFGKNDFSLQPQAGQFAIFHGGHRNLHEVTIVKKGARYTIGSFWDDREESDYPQEVRDEWAKELAEVRALQKNEQAEWQEVREKGLRLTPRGEQYPAEEVEPVNE
jgi:hypothetical protein